MKTFSIIHCTDFPCLDTHRAQRDGIAAREIGMAHCNLVS